MIPEDVVRVWTWNLDDPRLNRRWLLDDAERARADAFRASAHRSRFTAAHVGMRILLGSAAGRSPADLRFASGSHGKPFLSGGAAADLRFSLSHTEGWAALGISRGREIGVDIEAVRPVEADLPGRFFAAEEQAELSACPQCEWLDRFFAIWSRKEAVLKALGVGLSAPLSGFAVNSGSPPRLVRMESSLGAVERWRLADIDAPDGCRGALAAPADGWVIEAGGGIDALL